MPLIRPFLSIRNKLEECKNPPGATSSFIALAKYPEKVKEYKAGKKGLLGLFMGEVMKLSGGKADPKVASKLVQQELEK